MKETRLMGRLFSATEEGDEELTNQVASDIERAKKVGSVDTDEVRYDSNGDGSVSMTDKGNGEVTIAETAEDGAMELYPAGITENLEGYLHPGTDGVTPGQQQDENVEDAWSHIENGVVAPNVPGGGFNPQAGFEPSVEELANGHCCEEGDDNEEDDENEDGEGEEKQQEFSVYTNNSVVARIIDDQEFAERIFAEVIESEETAKVGDLKFEKIPGEDAVVATSESTGDQAKIEIEGDDLKVEELDSKNFGDIEGEEDFEQLHVVGVDPINHVLVDAPEYSEDSAQELADDLTSQGVDGVQIFNSPEEAREYAFDLLGNLGVDSEDNVGEPEQQEFSDHVIYVTKYFSNNTLFMDRMFSEAANDISASQDKIEDAIENGDEIETEDEIITPIDSKSAVIEDKDNGEFTKVTIDGDDMDIDPISRSEARDLTAHVEKDEGDDEDEDDEDDDDDHDDYDGDDSDDDDNDEDDDDEDEKDYSYFDEYEDERYYSEGYDDLDDVVTDESYTKYFSEYETMTDYMCRCFSDESDSKDIEKAIENGEQIETDTEIITPVDSSNAVVEDKKNGEFTKATVDEDGIDLKPITEEEADKLTEDTIVDDINEKDEDKDDDSDEEDDEKDYSYYDDDEDERYYSEEDEYYSAPLEKFFADINQQAMAPAAAPAQGGAAQVIPVQNPVQDQMAGQPVPVDENGNPIVEEGEEQPSLETIEDKAVAAVQQIQAAASEAEAAIMNAKSAPVQNQEPDLQEAQFSMGDYYDYDEDFDYADERTFSDSEDNTLVSWLANETSIR